MKKLVSILMSAILVFTLTGCGSPGPSDVADQFLKGIKDLNPEAIAQVYDVDEDDADDPEALDEEEQELLDKLKNGSLSKLFDFEYELSNEQINEDKATVDVKIKTYDLTGAYDALMNKAIEAAFSGEEMSDEEMENMIFRVLENEVDKSDQPTFTSEATISLEKTDGEWTVSDLEDNMQFMNALTGGLYKSFAELDD